MFKAQRMALKLLRPIGLAGSKLKAESSKQTFRVSAFASSFELSALS
jgi:hypothetical protein